MKAVMLGVKGGSKARRLGKSVSAVRSVSRRAKSACSRNSFAAGTLVLMADGSRQPIESIQVGDEVASTDPITGAVTAETVLDVIVGQGTKHLLEVSLDGLTQPLEVTANHPVWVEGKGWILAEDLTPSDHMIGATGGLHVVRMIHDEGWLSGQTVYNLHVTGDAHTYAVAADESVEPVVAHNSSGSCAAGVIYLRTDHMGRQYVGKAKSMKRYDKRRGEHSRNYRKSKFTFEIIDMGHPKSLKHLEEKHIQARGGLRPEGSHLQNRMHAINKTERRNQGYRHGV